MYILRSFLILTFFVACLIELYLAGTFYEEINAEVPQQSIIKRFNDVTPSTCLLKCRRNQECELAAMDGLDCLFLKKGIDGKEMISVILLEQIKIKHTGNMKYQNLL